MSKPKILSNQLLRTIEDEIERAVFRTGHYLPSEKELGLRFSVSRTTVRSALTQLSLKNRIHAIPGKGWCVGARPGRVTVISPRTPGEILLLARDSLHVTRLLNGFCEGLRQHGVTPRLAMPVGYESDITAVEEAVYRFRPAALAIFSDHALSPDYLQRLQLLGLPVAICGNPGHLDAPSYSFDFRTAAREMVAFLCNSGYRRIVYCNNASLRRANPSFQQRSQGYRDGTRAFGLPELLLDYDFRADLNPQIRESLGDTLQSMLPDRICLFCDTNELAIKIGQLLMQRNLSVPHQIGLAGFGNADDATVQAPWNFRRLCCVEENWHRIGYHSAWGLMNRLHGQEAAAALTLLPCPILPGDSICTTTDGLTGEKTPASAQSSGPLPPHEISVYELAPQP